MDSSVSEWDNQLAPVNALMQPAQQHVFYSTKSLQIFHEFEWKFPTSFGPRTFIREFILSDGDGI